jgi:hypothetical protein
MIELFVIAAVLLAVLILFYRQAIEQYNILQIEAAQMSDLPKLLSERSPVVVRDIGAPKLFTTETLKSNKRLLQFPLANQLTLGQYLTTPQVNVSLPKKASSLLAKESGLSVWAEHTWPSRLVSYPLLQPIHFLSTDVWIGEVGLRKTSALVTLLYPTSGSFEVTLLTEQQEKCLPPAWRGRFPEALTIQDTPLVGEIKYITIKLRPGTILCIPTHWFYSIRVVDPKAPAMGARITMDNPISWVASTMEQTLDA